MTTIKYSDQDYSLNDNESVLECLERHGVAIPFGCRKGVCQSCMMKSVEGTPTAVSQGGLKPTLQDQGYFLSCICKPETDLGVTLADASALPKVTAKVVEKTALNEHIIRLRIAPDSQLDYKPGQFINLHHNNITRSYSLASIQSEEFLELHIERLPNGLMSGWIHDDVCVGDNITIDGPHGDCYYLNNKPEQNLLLVGTGSGLAPLWGIARDAIAQGHRGEIHIFHGSRNADKLYLVDELKALSQQHEQVHYTPCASGESVPEGITAGRANAIALATHPSLSHWRIYLCGHPAMVNETKRKAFLSGASLQEIYADAFEIAADTKT